MRSEHGSRIVRTLSKATWMSAVWLLAFLGSFLSLPISDGLQVAGVISLISGLLAYIIADSKVDLHYNSFTLLVGALWFVAGISVICSDVPFVSLIYFFFFSGFPLTFLIISRLDKTLVFSVIRCITFTLAVVSLIQFYSFPDMLKFGGAHWPLEDNNSLAVILGSGALMFIGESLKGGRWSYHYLVAAILTFAGVMTTGGVAVFFGFFAVLGGMVWLSKVSSYKPLILFLMGVLFLICTMTRSDMSVYHFVETWTRSIDIITDKALMERNTISGSRLFIWESAIEIFKNNIWFGTGIGTFFLYYPEFRHIEDDSAGIAAHNDLLQFAAEMGVFAPFLALIIVGSFARQAMQKIREIKNTEDRLNLLVPFSVFGLIIGHSLVNFNMYVLPSLMMVGAMLGACNDHFQQRKINSYFSKSLCKIICSGLLIVGLIPLWGCYVSEYYTGKATKALARENIQEFSDSLNLADIWGGGQNGRAVLVAAQFSSATNDHNRALILLDRAQSLNPQLVQIHVERARILSSNDLEKAVSEARHALRMDPGSLTARMMVSDILYQLNRSDEAYTILKLGLKGIMKSRNPAPFYHMLASRSLEMGDIETNKIVLSRLGKLHRQ